MRLANKTDLITGAGQRFGLEIAERLARSAKIAILDLNHDIAKKAAGSIRAGAVAMCCDVSDAIAVERLGKARHRRQQCRHHAPKQANAGRHGGRIRPRHSALPR